MMASMTRDRIIAVATAELARKRVRPNVARDIVGRTEEIGGVRFLYRSRPGDGTSRYVFVGHVALGAREAIQHALDSLTDQN
jgi:hypothetical protein